MKPKVSFITSVKNRAQELKEMLATLVAQDMPEWEAIVVDDHSIEPIQQVVESFNDSRIRYYRLPKNQKGISRARNYGIYKAQSNFILVADSDDLNEPFRARLTYNIMTRNKCDVFYGNMRIFVVGRRTRGRVFQPFNRGLLMMINFIPNPTSAFRKDKFLKIGGYDPEFVVSEDYDLWLRFLKAGAKFCYTRKVLVSYRWSRKGISKRKRQLLHFYIQKARRKNEIEPVNIEKVRELARPGVARGILSKRGREVWQDDRFKGEAK